MPRIETEGKKDGATEANKGKVAKKRRGGEGERAEIEVKSKRKARRVERGGNGGRGG